MRLPRSAARRTRAYPPYRVSHPEGVQRHTVCLQQGMCRRVLWGCVLLRCLLPAVLVWPVMSGRVGAAGDEGWLARVREDKRKQERKPKSK